MIKGALEKTIEYMIASSDSESEIQRESNIPVNDEESFKNDPKALTQAKTIEETKEPKIIQKFFQSPTQSADAKKI
jgi:hypothetical protein